MVYATDYAVSELVYIEVEEQAQAAVGELEVRQKLSSVDGRDGLYRFHLNHKFAFYEDVDAVADVSELLAVLDQGNGHLCFNGQPALMELVHQAGLVGAFEQAGAEFIANGKGSVEHLPR